jgi:phytoene dehydrogenase-like protein
MKGKDTTSLGMRRPPELEGRFSNLKFMWEAKSMLKYMNKRYLHPIEKFAEEAKTESLKNYLTGIFTLEVPVFMALSFISATVDGQMGLLKGECKNFISKIENNYKSLGGDIRFKANVTKILTENNKACGVQLANGETIKGDYIVSASDSERSIYNLLEGKYTNPDIDRIHKTWKPADPYMLLTYGIDKDLNEEPTLGHIHLKQPINYGDKQLKRLFYRIMNYGDFAPKGKSIIQALIIPSWDYWQEVSKDKEKYLSEKTRFANEVLERLNSQYPGIKEKVEMTDVATPLTMQKFTLSKYGSSEGW